MLRSCLKYSLAGVWWMTGHTVGGLDPNFPRSDWTETARHNARQWKLLLSAPASAVAICAANDLLCVALERPDKTAICTSLIPWDPNLWRCAVMCTGWVLGSCEGHSHIFNLKPGEEGKKSNMAERWRTQCRMGGFSFSFFFFRRGVRAENVHLIQPQS